MRKKIIFSGVLGVAVLVLLVTANVMAQGAFMTDKTDRNLIKDLVVGQKAIQSSLQQISSQLNQVKMCK